MAPSTLVDFTPNGIDMVFAVSQQNLNQGLSEYMGGLDAPISWAFDVDDAGLLTPPKDAANPNISFSGTLASPIQPKTGGPVWILDLSKAGTANQVTFNLTFKDGATFTNHQTGHHYTQSASNGGALWVIPFQVTLTKNAIENTANLPQWLKDQLAILNGQYGHVFDLSQVLLDMQSLTFTADPKSVLPAGISLYEWTLILGGTTEIIRDQKEKIFARPPSAGYVVTHNGVAATQSLPTYTPTDADFVIIPNAANPGASTLVFALMVGTEKLPSSPSNAFANVSLINDPEITPGVALISAVKSTSFMQGDFINAGIDKAISQYVESIKSDGGVTWRLAANDTKAVPSGLTPGTGENGSKFTVFTMAQKKSSAYNYPFGAGTYTADSTTDSSAAVAYNNQQSGIGYRAITVSGTFSMTISHSFTPPGHGGNPPITSSWTSPRFDWNWTAWYAIQPVNAGDSESGGGVQFVLQENQSVFPTEPVAVGEGSSWGTVKPTEKDFVQRLLAPVVTALPGVFRSNFQSLSGLGSFVFPGGGTFTFQNPAVNNSFALYTTIQYQNPN
ncbi:hypothetical protein ACHAQA_006729 [Verticillium albo-atrum]